MPGTEGKLQQGNDDDLFVTVYEQLRVLAYKKLARETPGHTLQPTALVHEAYLRLVKNSHVHWENRRHFWAAAAAAMQRVLIDWARSKGSLKRGGEWKRVGMAHATVAFDGRATDIAEVGDALKEFETVDPRACQAIRLRYLVGLEIAEIAEIIEVSVRTVHKDLVVGKAWLRNQIESGSPAPPPHDPRLADPRPS